MRKIEFGKFIAERRRAAGYSQASLAEVLKCDPSTVGGIEIGRSLPSFEMFALIAEKLDINPSELLSQLLPDFKDPSPPPKWEPLRLPDILIEEDITQIKNYIETLRYSRAILLRSHSEQNNKPES